MGVIDGCVKIVLFVFNLVFALVGIALITLGTIYKLDISEFTKIIPADYDQIEVIPILTIVVGSIVFVIAFFGCCGAIKENSCLLTTYAVILLVIFILQIAVGVFGFLELKDRDDFDGKLNRTLEQLFSKYNKTEEATELVDLLQQELHCCGLNGSNYWPNSLPPSCCEDKNCNTQLYADGCQSAFSSFLHQVVRVIAITILTLSATEVVGAILSLCLANSLRNEDRRNRY